MIDNVVAEFNVNRRESQRLTHRCRSSTQAQTQKQDLLDYFEFTNASLYADDIAMMISSRPQVDLMVILPMESHPVSEWLKANCLTLNANKTENCVFATKPKLQHFAYYHLYIDGVLLELTSNFTYLAMILDEMLSCNAHIDHFHNRFHHVWVLR